MKSFKLLKERFDSNEMHALILSLPSQLREAISLAYSYKLSEKLKKINKILIQGMGGSSIAGFILKNLFEEKIRIPIIIKQNYDLPSFTDKKTLIFFVSYSGNTEETLTAMKEAKKRKLKFIAITSNGILSRKAKNKIIIPKGFPPRTQIFMILLPMIAVLEKLNLIKEKNNLMKAAKILERKMNAIERKAKLIALKLKKRIPVIYCDEKIYSIALRLHCQLAENSNTFSHLNFLPELNHNEIVGFKPLEEKLCFVFLRHSNESKEIKKRFKITKKLLPNKNLIELKAKNKNFLNDLIELLVLSDFISYYLALLYNVNPTEIKNIELIKKELND